MSGRMFSSEAKIRLTQVINSGMSTLNEIEVLRNDLSESIKAVAKELDIKPAVLKKAIAVAHKSQLTETNKDNELLNDVLETVGRTV